MPGPLACFRQAFSDRSRSSRGGRFYAYRADCTVDRGHSTEALRRHRARRFLADRGAGGARPRCHAVRQRRFGDVGQARADVAARAAPRRFGARSDGAAHRRCWSACAAAPAEFDVLHFHLDYFPFSVFSRQATPFVTTMHGRLDLPEHQTVFNAFRSVPVVSISERPAQAGAAGALAEHDLSRPAGRPAAATRREVRLSRLPRPHRAGEGGRPGDPHRRALRPAAQDRRQGRPRRSRLFRARDPAVARPAGHRVYRRDRRSRTNRSS